MTERKRKNMSFASKYNKGNIIFDIDIKDYVFMDGYKFVEKMEVM